MSLNEPTLGEIARRLDDLSADVKNIPAAIAVFGEKQSNLSYRLERLEARHEWLWRTVGGIILAGLGTIFTNFR